MTIALHVDDLMIINLHDENLDSFCEHLKRTFKETKIVVIVLESPLEIVSMKSLLTAE